MAKGIEKAKEPATILDRLQADWRRFNELDAALADPVNATDPAKIEEVPVLCRANPNRRHKMQVLFVFLGRGVFNRAPYQSFEGRWASIYAERPIHLPSLQFSKNNLRARH